jgi:hypothetical protein
LVCSLLLIWSSSSSWCWCSCSWCFPSWFTPYSKLPPNFYFVSYGSKRCNLIATCPYLHIVLLHVVSPPIVLLLCFPNFNSCSWMDLLGSQFENYCEKNHLLFLHLL